MIKDNSCPNFSAEKKKCNKAFRGVYFLTMREKNFKSNVVLVVILVLEPEGLCCYAHSQFHWLPIF